MFPRFIIQLGSTVKATTGVHPWHLIVNHLAPHAHHAAHLLSLHR